MVEAQGVVKRFGDVLALKDASLRVQRGEFFGLLGPNGAGKSTLMSCLTGYLVPDEGTITYDGQPFRRHASEMRRLYGLVPQQIALFPTLGAAENLRICGRFYGLSGRALHQRADNLLELVGLQDRRDDPVKDFSGGMKRRLNIAASLMHEPPILYCDEPTVGVDPQSRNAIFDLLQQLNAQGTTIVYTSHYMEEVTRLCRRIAIIDHGHVIAQGALADLLGLLPGRREIGFPAGEAATAFAAGGARSFGAVEAAPNGAGPHLLPGPGFDVVAFLSAARDAGLDPWDFRFKEPTLEDVFLHLTGRTLRD